MLRHLKTIFAAILTILLFFPHAGAQDMPTQRKKVGVVLSGGGAKGVAHITALKVLEEAGIPIDYITGTSMGAIIGGLYAIGYDTHTLDSMVRAQDWPLLLSDRVSRQNLSFSSKENREKYVLTVPLDKKKKFSMPSGLVSGQNVYNLLTELTIGYHDSISFKDLPIPFACVAYDLVVGKAIPLDCGNLPLSIRASMSIPGAFEPVRMNDMVLIDGGISNNFPVDVIKEMGAEIIIGVDVTSRKREEDQIESVADMFNQITYFTGEEAYKRNLPYVDLIIQPDITGYGAGSFSAQAIDSLLIRGEAAARCKWDDIVALKSEIGIPQQWMPEERDHEDPNKVIPIKHIKFEGLESQKEKTLRRICGLREYSIVTSSDIHNSVALLQGTGTLSEVQYSLEGTPPYDIVYKVKESTRNSVALGVRFDTEEMAAILLHASIAPNYLSNSHFEVTGRLSENPYAKGAYIFGNNMERQLNISYKYKYNDLSLYSYGDKLSNLDFSHHTVDINYSNIQFRNFKLTVGLSYDFYDYRTLLSMRQIESRMKSEGLVSYYGVARFESFDRRYNPTSGVSFQLGYNFYTTDFATYHGNNPFSAAYLNFHAAISVSRRVTFLPTVFGRVLIGNNFSFAAANFMGGSVAGRYMPQQMPFIGIRRFEAFENSVLGAGLDFRVRLWSKSFVSLKSNFAKEDDNFFNLPAGNNIWGAGLAFSHNTIIGPIDFLVDWSNHTRSLGAYFNFGYYF